jgi:hypothetical protein
LSPVRVSVLLPALGPFLVIADNTGESKEKLVAPVPNLSSSLTVWSII